MPFRSTLSTKEYVPFLVEIFVEHLRDNASIYSALFQIERPFSLVPLRTKEEGLSFSFIEASL